MQFIEIVLSNMVVYAWQLNKSSIIIDASKYIEKLKQKVERLNQEIASAETSSAHDPLPTVFS